MTLIPEIKPEPMAPAIVVGSLITLTLIAAALAWSIWAPEPEQKWTAEERAQIRSGIHFPALYVDAEKLEASRQNHNEYPDLTLAESDVENLRSLVRRANLAQFPPQDPQTAATKRDLEFQLDAMADEVLPVTGVRGFHAAGEPIFERCHRGLNELLHAVQRDELPLSQAVEDPPRERFYQYRENCGNLLPILLNRHLVAPDGEWNHKFSQVIIDILQRYRWADLIHTRYSTHRQLPPYDLEIFYRWSIEDPNAFTIQERRRFLHQARNVLPDNYDLDLARARLDVAAQDLQSAADRMADLVEEHPHTALYAAIHDEIRRQLARSSR